MDITLYRATSHDHARTGAHFCAQEEAARAFLEEGDRIRTFQLSVDDAEVLDARPGVRALAAVVAGLTGRSALDVEERWWGRRLKSVFEILESDDETVQAIARTYGWVRFDEDFPPGAEGWLYLGAEPLPL